MELALIEQHHQENNRVLVKILEVLSTQQDIQIPAPIVNVAPAVVNVPAPVVNVPAPIVNVEKNNVTLNQEKVVAAVELLRAEQAKPKPLAQWQFDVVRDADKCIISVNAKQIK